MSLIYTPSYKRGASAPAPEQPPEPQRAPAPRSRSLLEKIEGGVKSVGIDTWVGAAKSAADTALGFGELGQKIFNPWSWAGSEEAKKSQEFARDLRESKYVAPQTTGESIGFVGGKIAQAFIPGGLGMTGARAAAGLSSAPTAIRAAGAFATEALPATLMAAGEEGGLTRDSLINGLLQGTTGVGGKIPNIAVGGVQMARGAKQAMEGDISGGALTAGFGALGVATGARTKGLLLNKAVFTPNVEKEMEKAVKEFDNILGPQKRQAKIAQDKRLKGQTVKSPGQVAMEHRIFTTEGADGKLVSTLDTDANGRLVTDNARLEVADRLNKWEDDLDNVLDDNYQRNSLVSLKDRAIKDIKDGKVSGIRSASDRKAAIADMESWFADEIEAAGELVTDKKLNEIKRGLNSAYREGAPKLGYEAQRAARSILQKEVVKNTKDVDAQKISNIMGDLLELDRYLKNAQERAIQGGKLTKSLRGIAGNIIGAQFGPFGSFVGGQVGEMAHDFAVDPYRRMIAAQEGLTSARYSSPVDKFRGEIGQAMQARVQSNLTGEGKPKMLPAPSAIYAPAQTSTGPKMMSQRDAVDSLRSTGSLPSEDEIRASMSGSPLKRMELLQRVQTISERDAARVAQREMTSLNKFSSELESGYSSFKGAASKSPMMLDEAFDASSLESRLGPKKYREIIASSGSDMSDDEILSMFKSRLTRERSANELRNKQSPYELFGVAAGLEVDQSEDGSLEFKGFDPTKAAMGFAGMTVAKKFKGKAPKVDLATQKEMMEVIDYARLKPGFNQKIEENAGLLAEKYGINAKSIPELANKFDEWLQTIRKTKGYESLFRKQ